MPTLSLKWERASSTWPSCTSKVPEPCILSASPCPSTWYTLVRSFKVVENLAYLKLLVRVASRVNVCSLQQESPGRCTRWKQMSWWGYLHLQTSWWRIRWMRHPASAGIINYHSVTQLVMLIKLILTLAWLRLAKGLHLDAELNLNSKWLKTLLFRERRDGQ